MHQQLNVSFNGVHHEFFSYIAHNGTQRQRLHFGWRKFIGSLHAAYIQKFSYHALQTHCFFVNQKAVTLNHVLIGNSAVAYCLVIAADNGQRRAQFV